MPTLDRPIFQCGKLAGARPNQLTVAADFAQFVACALVRAASRFIGMLGEHPQSQRSSAGRREESGRGTHECVRHVGAPITSRFLPAAAPGGDHAPEFT